MKRGEEANRRKAARTGLAKQGLAAAILGDKALLPLLTRAEQLVVAKRYLDPEASWSAIGGQLGMSRYAAAGAWRRAVAKQGR